MRRKINEAVIKKRATVTYEKSWQFERQTNGRLFSNGEKVKD